MINIPDFKIFLTKTFNPALIYFEEFKPDLYFYEVKCFSLESPNKLAIELSPETIKLSIISKSPALDFSLHDHVFTENKTAEEFIIRISKEGKYPSTID